MFKDGIGEGSRFSGSHPLVNLIYYGFVIGITMFTVDPYFLALTLVGAWVYSALLRGRAAHKINVLFALPVLVFTTIVNGFFNHNGDTVLFFIRNNRITMEAFCYGIASAALFSAIIIWFVSFNVVMTSEKLIFIFGKAAPVLGLTLSMIFRFIPLLRERFKEIRMGQQCMGRTAEGGLVARTRQLTKEVSILISWSLEASIETADSMEARGYGLKGRTSFTLFKMTASDKRLLALITVLGVISTVGAFLKKTQILYYPVVVMGSWDLMKAVTFVAFGALIFVPIIFDYLGEKRWQQLMSEI